MTDKEKVIVSAYTGYLMTDHNEVHKYIEQKIGRPVWPHEFVIQEVQQEVHDACRDDFLALCSSTTDENQMTIGF